MQSKPTCPPNRPWKHKIPKWTLLFWVAAAIGWVIFTYRILINPNDV